MIEQVKVSEKLDKNTAAIEYILTIVADIETFAAYTADYIVFYNDFKIKYNIVDEKQIEENKLLEIDENDLANLKQKSYNVRAQLIKMFQKLKALSQVVKYDFSELDKLYNEVKKSVVIKDTILEELLYHMNLMIQSSLLSNILDVVYYSKYFRSVQKA